MGVMGEIMGIILLCVGMYCIGFFCGYAQWKQYELERKKKVDMLIAADILKKGARKGG